MLISPISQTKYHVKVSLVQTWIFYMNFEVVIAICTWIFLKMTLYLSQKTKYDQTLLVGSQVWYELSIYNIEIKPV